MSEKKEKAKRMPLEKWLEIQERENKERLKAKLEEKGRKPYLTVEVGSNKFTLLPEIPTARVSNWGKDQAVFTVEQGGEAYDWPVTKSSPMYIKVCRMMPAAPTAVELIRTGTGRDTRLDLK